MRDLDMKIPSHIHELTVTEAYELGWEHATANPAPPSPETGQDGWQPIETAPKTAERFHAWESYPEWPAPHGRVITAWWQAFGDDQGWQNDNVHAPVAGTLTHWMPLPTPPSEGSKS